MAERISELPPPRRGGRRPIYPWDEWMDGSAWRITRGVDFSVETRVMVTNIYAHAHRRGIGVSVRPDDESVDFQFEPREMAA